MWIIKAVKKKKKNTDTLRDILVFSNEKEKKEKKKTLPPLFWLYHIISFHNSVAHTPPLVFAFFK